MATPYQPPAWPPPAPRRRNPALIIFFIILGFLVLMFGGCAVVVVAGAYEADQVAASPTPHAAKKAYAMGQAAKDGEFTFVVTRISTTAHIGNSLTGSDAQGRFVVVDIDVTNNGTTARLLDSANQHLIAAGKTYDANDNVFVDSKAFLNNINPGNGVQAQLAFDVPVTTADANVADRKSVV